MPDQIYTVRIDGTEYDLQGDHPPTEAEARAAIGSQTKEPPKVATPPPASATIGMMQPSTKDGITNEEFANLPLNDKLRNVAQWGGKAILGMVGGGAPGSVKPNEDTVNHPGTTLAMAAAPMVIQKIREVAPAVIDAGARAAGVSTVRAGKNIQTALSAAADTPIDLADVRPALEEAQAKASYLGSRKAINTLAKRVADDAAPMLAPEGQQAASALSELSKTAKPAMRRPLMQLANALRGATGTAADEAATFNLGAEAMPGQYQEGIDEYRRAMLAKSLAKKGVAAAGTVGALDWLRRSRIGQAAEGWLK